MANKYPYRYTHFDKAVKTGLGTYKAGTIIHASRIVLTKMLRLYRISKKRKPLSDLTQYGVFRDVKRNRILITHPNPLAKRHQVEEFPHREIASQITKLWRHDNKRNGTDVNPPVEFRGNN